MPINFKITHLESVDSTSNYVATAVAQGKLGHGSVILADKQTAGRGQRESTWQSEGGLNLLFSFLLIPDNMSASDVQGLMHCVTLALVDVLRSFGIEAQVKWPNDIYVAKQKIAGILIENQLSGARISRSIVGVGLNVNQVEFGALNATSIAKETAGFADVKDVLLRFLHQFEGYWTRFLRHEFSELKSHYISVLFGLNETLSFVDERGGFDGVILGVDEVGRLVVLSDRGKKSYDLKEIQFKL